MRKYTKLLFLFVVLIFIDQISKYLASNSVCNQNLAWNIPLPVAIFYFVWSLIIIALIFLFFKTKFYFHKFFIALIASGAVSNIIDRIRLGCVVDYIDLKFWPVFNLADIFITVGIISLLFVIASEAKQSHAS